MNAKRWERDGPWTILDFVTVEVRSKNLPTWIEIVPTTEEAEGLARRLSIGRLGASAHFVRWHYTTREADWRKWQWIEVSRWAWTLL